MKRQLILSALIGGLVLGSFAVRADEEDEGKEQKVNMTDVPAAVKDTLTKEAEGATLPDHVDKETGKSGKVVYEADVVINNKNYEIVVAPDGTLIHKKLDMEDSDKKGEKDEKDEKNEKK